MNDKERHLRDLLVSGLYEDGQHHKQWYLDQALRVLTDCPFEERQALDVNKKPYTYLALGESEQYTALKSENQEEYGDWETGIAP